MHLTRFVPRLTIRRLMAVVAVMAMALVAQVRVVRPWCDRRSAHFHELSRFHQALWAWEKAKKQGGSVVLVTPELDSYHREMAAKYQWAEQYPWLPVAPDPPEPE